jgi:hypothetical protein
MQTNQSEGAGSSPVSPASLLDMMASSSVVERHEIQYDLQGLSK